MYSPREADNDMPGEVVYSVIHTDKSRTEFTFRKAPFELLFASMGPQRSFPPRFSVNRLRDWKPDLDDLLILGASHSIDFAFMVKTTAPIASDQTVTDDLDVATISEDNRKPQLPQVSLYRPYKISPKRAHCIF